VPAAGRVAQLAQRFGFDLPNALAGYIKITAYLFKRVVLAVVLEVDRELVHPEVAKRVEPLELRRSDGMFFNGADFDPTGRWLFAANQGSDEIRLFKIDPSSGRLAATSRLWKVVTPVCVLVVPIE